MRRASETEIERIAGAWPPHADLILLLQRRGDNRARLSVPKTRWAQGQRPASILAFDPDTETFTYVADDEPEDRDLVNELTALMADCEWRTVSGLRQSKKKGGIGARPEKIIEALADERFEATSGDHLGKRKSDTYYRLRPPDGAVSRGPGDTRDTAPVRVRGGEQCHGVTTSKGVGAGGDTEHTAPDPARSPGDAGDGDPAEVEQPPEDGIPW